MTNLYPSNKSAYQVTDHQASKDDPNRTYTVYLSNSEVRDLFSNNDQVSSISEHFKEYGTKRYTVRAFSDIYRKRA
jgi:subtilase family serine protease